MNISRRLGTLTSSLLAACALGLTFATTQAQSPSVIPDHTVYHIGEDIRVTFANGTGNAKDWIGVYPADVTPGPGSTIWSYVDGTQTGNTGIREGTITFLGGLGAAGDWKVHYLPNDLYTSVAEAPFSVVDTTMPLVRSNKRTYVTGEAITITFTNGLANAKDWLGLYQAGVTPSAANPSIDWFFVDGTQTGNTGLDHGTVTFLNGLPTPGNYAVHFLLNDGYDILASESFIVTSPAGTTPRILSVQPAANATNLPPIIAYLARITNGSSRVVTSTLQLQLDASTIPATITSLNELVTVAYTNTSLFLPGSQHSYRLTFSDDATPAGRYTNEINITIAPYRDIVLPAPLHFENFDTTAEDSIPTGWTQKSYTDVQNPDFDLTNLDSASYAKWTVVNADRFQGSFVTYSNPDNPDDWESDYHRVLNINPLVVKDGQIYGKPLAEGRFIFGDSGYRNGASQVLYLFTPDWDVTGKTNIYLSFHSLWEQNQDSLAAIEYSIDQGQNWQPIAYFLDPPDVLLITNSTSGEVSIDAVATFTTDYGDVAHYTDDLGIDQGGHYGAFIAAPVSPDLAPFIQPRVDNDTVGSKRIELFRLPLADNQSKVRVRFAHAGTDSWYFGLDNVGLYALSSSTTSPRLDVSRTGNQLTLTWPSNGGFQLWSTPTLANLNWSLVTGVTGNSYTVTATGTSQFYQIRP